MSRVVTEVRGVSGPQKVFDGARGRRQSKFVAQSLGEQGGPLPSTVLVIPSARRLMESLRDIGYELPNAVADLVDNSLDADATEVGITVQFEGEDSWIRVTDNGVGMTTARLNEAMRYGTERDYDDVDLGKFGLGLKTASLSQCRRLTVATRTNASRREIEIRRWDLDRVIDADKWELIRLSPSDVRDELVQPLWDGPGTVVMWEQLDRIFDYKLPSGRAAEAGLAASCRDIEDHLAMVFHRFLARQARRSLPLTITMQDEPVDAWDPFSTRERHTAKLERQTLSLRHGGRAHSVTIQPYILPNKMQYSTTREWEAASGPQKWNRQQGFYFYRGGRMIQSGGWNHIRTFEEHTKLARIAVDIPRSADAAFGVNVAKMRVAIPIEIRAEMKAIASAVTTLAQRAYRQPGGASDRPTTAARAASSTARSDAAATRSGGRSRGGSVPWSTLRRVLRDELADDQPLLERLLKALREAAGTED